MAHRSVHPPAGWQGSHHLMVVLQPSFNVDPVVVLLADPAVELAELSARRRQREQSAVWRVFSQLPRSRFSARFLMIGLPAR